MFSTQCLILTSKSFIDIYTFEPQMSKLTCLTFRLLEFIYLSIGPLSLVPDEGWGVLALSLSLVQDLYNSVFFHFLGSDKNGVCRAVWRSMLRALRQRLLPSGMRRWLLRSQGHGLLCTSHTATQCISIQPFDSFPFQLCLPFLVPHAVLPRQNAILLSNLLKCLSLL